MKVALLVIASLECFAFVLLTLQYGESGGKPDGRTVGNYAITAFGGLVLAILTIVYVT